MSSSPPSHPSAVPGVSGRQRLRAAQKVTLVSLGVNVGLSALQIVVGFFSRSQALLTDGLHTLSDVLSDLLVLFASHHGAVEADERHPYGHKRIETAATLFLGVVLMIVGVSFLWKAGVRLQSAAAMQKVHVAALWIAFLTLVSKETLYHYMMRAARRLHSQLLAANAWHTRADAATSLIGTIGIAGNLLGYTFMDSLAAALVAFMIVRMGWKLAYDAVTELIDTGLDAREVEAIRQTLCDTPGVQGLHELRTRKMGEQALVDAHVLVDPRISVSEGHYIAETARARLRERHHVLDAMVHVDPEDDSIAKPALVLPDRDTLLAHLAQELNISPEEADKVIFHYLEGKVDAEIFLSAAYADPARMAALRVAMGAVMENNSYFRTIHLHLRAAP